MKDDKRYNFREGDLFVCMIDYSYKQEDIFSFRAVHIQITKVEGDNITFKMLFPPDEHDKILLSDGTYLMCGHTDLKRVWVIDRMKNKSLWRVNSITNNGDNFNYSKR